MLACLVQSSRPSRVRFGLAWPGPAANISLSASGWSFSPPPPPSEAQSRNFRRSSRSGLLRPHLGVVLFFWLGKKLISLPPPFTGGGRDSAIVFVGTWRGCSSGRPWRGWRGPSAATAAARSRSAAFPALPRCSSFLYIHTYTHNNKRGKSTSFLLSNVEEGGAEFFLVRCQNVSTLPTRCNLQLPSVRHYLPPQECHDVHRLTKSRVSSCNLQLPSVWDSLPPRDYGNVQLTKSWVQSIDDGAFGPFSSNLEAVDRLGDRRSPCL